MSQAYRQANVSRLCRLLGLTRQSYYQHMHRQKVRKTNHELLVEHIRLLRKSHPRMGGRKLHTKLIPFMRQHGIKMGRDRLFELLKEHRLLIVKKKSPIRTTQSSHWLRKYPNLIKDFTPTAPNQLWVADITYWKTQTRYVYISLVTDAYSHKIVGYQVSDSLASTQTLVALKKALRSNKADKLIHHSDRGIQYCSSLYIALLKAYKVSISMTQTGDPLENPIAERINGILKQEYLARDAITSLRQARTELKRAVHLYNNERPHMSIGMLTPAHVHRTGKHSKRVWKNYYLKNRTLKTQPT